LQGLNRDGTASKYNERYVKWAHLTAAPFLISDRCCAIMKHRPINKHLKATGEMPIVGTLASESFRRQSAYLKSGCNAYFNKEPKSAPLSFWTEQDILEYLRITKIPYASIYGDIVTDPKTKKLKMTGVSRSGCMYCQYGVHLERQPNRFQQMKLTHPKIYDYCINELGCGQVLDYIGVPY
jgi:3'-phosphoadenosine 5'-phosphosulfate sulfotransferase (PAPS reductase)/FAD synthetase